MKNALQKVLGMLLLTIALASPTLAQTTLGQQIFTGVGSPEGVQLGNPGDAFLSWNGTQYIKGSGNGKTGWTIVAVSGGQGGQVVNLPVAICQGSGVSIGGSGAAATLPATQCNAGSTTVPQGGAQVYAQASLGTLYVDYAIVLPSTWTKVASIVFKVYNDTATTGTDYMNFQYKCVADGSTFAPTYAAVQQASGAVPGTINQFVTLTLANPTITGCAAGNIMYIRIGAGTGAGAFASGNLDLAMAKVELQ